MVKGPHHSIIKLYLTQVAQYGYIHSCMETYMYMMIKLVYRVTFKTDDGVAAADDDTKHRCCC